MGLDFDVLEFCRKLRTSKQPPYTCPVVECSKFYKSMCGLQYHLVNFDHHNNTATQIDIGGAGDSTSVIPVMKKGRKKGRGSHMKCTTPVTNDSLTSPGREGLTYAEAQKLVEFEINGKVTRISIHEPMQLVSKNQYESNVTSSPNPGSTSQYQGSVALTKSQEAVTKLPEPCFTELFDYNITDSTPRPNAYIRFIERSAEELDGEVEYDMDEEDAAWLVLVNERRVIFGLPEVPIDTFELLMDRLEKESYFQMQTNKAGGSSTSSVIDDDAVCCICMDGECQNSNVILFCDMCNLAVHQDCYGVPYIPEGQWLCRRCLQSPSRAVDCVLCPNNGGAFKQTDRGHWAHVVCALWIPEVRFANTVFLEPIDSIETIPPARWKLTCYICKQRGVGACIQCHKTNCYSAFHVTCAQQAGLFMKMDAVRDSHTVGGEPGPLLVQKTAFCDSHTPADAETRQRITSALAPPTISNSSPLPTSSHDDAKMKSARRLLAKKRSSVPVISIPTIPPDRIQEIGSLVSLPKKSQFITRLIAYWTLKRQFRNGVPLLRRLQSSHLARRDEPCHSHQVVSDIGELYRQLKYWQCLRQDLERARLLCELVRKREKLKKELVKIKSMCMEVELCPLVSFLRGLVDLLRARDTGEIFIEPVDQSEVPDYRDIVKHPMDLSTMRNKVDAFKYPSLNEFEEDFHLMIDNCLAYNAKDTVFYRAAIKMRDQGGALLQQARKDMEIMGSEANFSSPLYGRDKERSIIFPRISMVSTATAGDEANAAEIDKQLAAMADPNNDMGKDEIMCKLLQLLDSSQNLKHGLARAKRVKLVKAEISKLRKKMNDDISVSQQNTGNKDSTDADADGDSSEEEVPKKLPKTPVPSEAVPVAKKRTIDESSILTVKRRRRKKTWDDFVEGPISNKTSTQMSSSNVAVTPEKESASKPPPASPSTQSPGSDAQVTISPSGVNRRTAVLFTRKAAAATRQFKKPDMPPSPVPTSSTSANTGSRRRGRQAKRHLGYALSSESFEEVVSSTTLPCSDSFRVYRSGGDMKGESDEESRSDDETSCSICSSSDGSSVSGSGSGSGSGWSDSEESAVSGGGAVQEALEQLQLVWAKCRGYPWYPALIINPKMPRGYVHNGVPIPSPPADVLALANNYTEPVYLVLFFDTKRTWQWLPRNKLEPLGITPELDQIKLIESRKPTDRKAVKKAYQEAMTHRTQVDKKDEPAKIFCTTVTEIAVR